MAQHSSTEKYAPPLDDALVQFEESAQSVPTRSELNRVEHKSDRNRTIAIALAILIGLASLAYNVFNTSQIAETAAESQLNSESIEALRLVRDQLRESGVPESELPPEIPPTDVDGGVDLSAIVQATAAIVLADVRSDPRYRGPQGPDGLPCDPVFDERCIGPEGAEGEPGEPGADSPCVADIEACRGPQGPAGPVYSPAIAVFTRLNPDDQDTCVYRLTFTGPGLPDIVLEAPVPGEFCPDPPPATARGVTWRSTW